MKKLAIGLMCISLLLTLVGTTTAKGKPTKPTYLTNEDKLYKFQKLSKAWKEKEVGKFNDYWFVRRDHSAIFIGSRTYTVPLEEFDLSATQHEWIKVMQKKYKLKNLKIIDKDHITIDEHQAFWSVTEMKIRGSAWKEKIYLVQGDKFYYRLRLSCPERYFDEHLEEFEELVNSFKLLPFKAPVITKTPTYLTNEDRLYQFQRPGKAWGEKDPGKFNDYWFTNRRHQMTSIYIGSRIYTTELEDFDLSAAQHSWIKAIQKKYKLKNMKIIEEADTIIDEHPAVWSVIEYKVPRWIRKEKIYLVKGDKFYYRLRLTCPKRYFDKHLEEFEQLVKSFKLL